MPALPITDKDTAWNYWKAGLVAAANVGLSVNATSLDTVTQTLRNLALKKGYNALRLQLAWADQFSIQEADIATIASQGWDSTTATSATAGTATPVSFKTVASQIDNILKVSGSLGMGVILTVMVFQQGPGGQLWQQQASQDQLVNFWTKTAHRWPAASWPQLIGYDILNEPSPEQSLSFEELNATTLNGLTNLNNWRALANRIVATIRATDSKTPIIVEGIYGGAPRGLDVFRNLNDATDRTRLVQDSASRIVYSFHMYAPLPFTHQGVANWAYEAMGTLYRDTSYPTPYWHVWDFYNPDPAARGGANLGQTFTGPDSLLSYYRNDAYYANKVSGAVNPNQPFHTQFGVPIFVGEFSAIDTSQTKASGVDADDPHRSITALSLANNVVTVTLASIDSQGFRIDMGGSDAAYPFTNTVRVTITGSGTVLDNVSADATLRAGDKSFTFTYASSATVNMGGGTTKIATLTLSPTTTKKPLLDASRERYTKDVLQFCSSQGFSWAWHFEDNDLANEFNGWRPSASVSAALRGAAAGNTIINA